MRIYTIILIMLAVGMLIGLTLIFAGVGQVNKYTKFVKCYDRYSNEIIGQQCEEIVFEYPTITNIGLIVFGIFFMLFLMAVGTSDIWNGDIW